MPALDACFEGTIPEVYDRLLVPLIFEDFAEHLAERAAIGAPDSVLETAAGSGALTRALARALPAATRIVATDLNAPMLEHARARHDGGRPVDWLPADALQLPFPAASFDAVACQFGVMFFPDRIRAYAEVRRVLRPGGRFLFSVWDRIEANGFAHAVTEALAELWPDDPPRFLARTPHGHGHPDLIMRELVEAGFPPARIEPLAGRSRAASAREPAIAYCQGTPLRSEIEARDPAGLARATEHAARAIARRWGDGPVSAGIRGFVVEVAAPG
ncbi:methyltransferase domain-containing protein [Limibaculum sp. FT325]|uniref:class I SAM-dependent methyltransferase n=1 Tax=Thermohalobaculum sediminis TaxID=2939436 RepID=UPI0020BEB394|nr:methyltransferase domain-containing protein [Limibaculum sediminis]MCL5778173.1 methyltransferase domain-containing protein [Limibaculum sediminis]